MTLPSGPAYNRWAGWVQWLDTARQRALFERYGTLELYEILDRAAKVDPHLVAKLEPLGFQDCGKGDGLRIRRSGPGVSLAVIAELVADLTLEAAEAQPAKAGRPEKEISGADRKAVYGLLADPDVSKREIAQRTGLSRYAVDKIEIERNGGRKLA